MQRAADGEQYGIACSAAELFQKQTGRLVQTHPAHRTAEADQSDNGSHHPAGNMSVARVRTSVEKDDYVIADKECLYTKDSFGDCQLHVEWAEPAKIGPENGTPITAVVSRARSFGFSKSNDHAGTERG